MKNHTPGPVPKGNQPQAGPKFDRFKDDVEAEDGAIEGAEREQGDRQDVRENHGFHQAPRADAIKKIK